MKRLIVLACAMLLVVTGAAFATSTVTLTQLSGHVFQQTTNNPCVVGDPSCNEPANFTYTSQAGPGAGGSYDLISPFYVTGSNPYSGNIIPLSFQIGIDENLGTGQGTEVLTKFNIFTCSTNNTGCQLAWSLAGPTPLPFSSNGNGFADYLSNQFTFTAGQHLYFEFAMSNDTDGMEEFFIIPLGAPVVPEPGTMLLLGSGLLAGAGAIRRKLFR